MIFFFLFDKMQFKQLTMNSQACSGLLFFGQEVSEKHLIN